MRRSGTNNLTEGKEFKQLAPLLKAKNKVVAHLMNSTGDSSLEATYVMNVASSDWKQSARLEFDPKKIKNKSGNKIASYYRYSTTELDLTADTFKEANAKRTM